MICELSATILELMFEIDKDFVDQNSKRLYGEHQQNTGKNKLILTKPPVMGTTHSIQLLGIKHIVSNLIINI